MSSSELIDRLLEAIEHDNLVEIRKILSKEGIDLNCDVTMGEEFGLQEPEEVPLLFYVIMNHISAEAFELLLQAGLDINYTNTEGLGAIDIAIKYRRHNIVRRCKEAGISLNESRRKSGMTPLMLAAAFNDLEMVEYLIKEGADINTVDNYGMTALDYAKKMGQGRVKELLESVGAIHKLYKD